MKKILAVIMLISVYSLALTGCFKAPQVEPEEQQPVQEEEAVETKTTTTYENQIVGFTFEVPVSWGGVGVSPDLGDVLIVSSKADRTKTFDINMIETRYKDRLSGGDLDEVWLGENSEWAFYYNEGAVLSAEAQGILKTFKAVNPVKYATVKEKIENLDSRGWNLHGVVVYNCSKEAEQLNEALQGTERWVPLREGGGGYFINIIKTANPDKLTKEQLQAIADPCSELGSNQVLKVTDNYILWGYPQCSAGAIPDEELQKEGYAAYQECLKVEKELNDYLGL